MAATPRKLVHWALDVSMSEFGSPFSDGSSTDSMVSTSSLQYINSQLVAHGFSAAPGLSFDGLSNSDSERAVKCILAMLSQRVEDMSRAEDLTTKFRTLSYDHERLMTMHRAANEKAAYAEREMNLHKSRLAAANRSLQSSESAHKHTTAELQRTRAILQGIRLTHQAELKKKEKEIERMVDKWSKLADAQIKLSTTAASGLQLCANGNVDVPENMLGKGQGYLEIALEQAEKVRSELAEENALLRRLIVSAVNDVQRVLHLARCLVSENQEEPTPFTQTTLFPLHPPTAASDKLRALLTSLRESLTVLSRMATERAITVPAPATVKPETPDGEIERLQAIIDALRVEIDSAHKQSAAHAAETQALFDGLQTQPLIARAMDIGEVSIDLMITPAKDEERYRIEVTKKELEEERRKFTEAAVKLGREKVALEAERIRFLDEKRSWQVEQMLAELPPTPAPATTGASSPVRLKPSASDPGQYPTTVLHKSPPRKSPRKSPRHSPSKPTTVVVGKAGTGRNIRVSRRSSLGLGLAERLEPAFETEVMPPAFPFAKVSTMSQSLLPTSFVLPPPSPHSSLPRAPALLSSTLLPAFQLPAPVDAKLEPSTEPTSQLSSKAPSLNTPPGPRHPFPTAKPYATRMIHAYSPAKPSPLSRILMLNNSITSPPNPATFLEDLVEEQEHSPTNNVTVFTKPNSNPPANNIAAEMGMEESPLREKTAESNMNVKTVDSEAKRLTAKEKGKGKADPLLMTMSKSGGPGVVEKENQVKIKGTRAASSGSVTTGATSKPKLKVAATSADGMKTIKPSARPASSTISGTTMIGMKLIPGKGGARRVPIDSAEAAPVGPGWRG